MNTGPLSGKSYEPFHGALRSSNDNKHADGAYYYIPDVLVVRSGGMRTAWHEIEHRMASLYDRDYSGLTIWRALATQSHRLLRAISAVVSEPALDTRLTRLTGGHISVECSNNERQAYVNTLLHRWVTVEREIDEGMRWISLVHEIIAIDGSADGPEVYRPTNPDRTFRATVTAQVGEFEDVPEVVDKAMRAWSVIRSLDTEDSGRTALLHLAMTCARPGTSTGANDPLTMLVDYGKLYSEQGRRSLRVIGAARRTVAADSRATLRRMRRWSQRPLSREDRNYVSGIQIVHALRGAQRALNHNSPAEKQARSEILDQMIAAVDVPRLYAYRPPVGWSQFKMPFIMIELIAERMVARFNPYHLMRVQGADWWESMLFLERLRWSLKSGHRLVCPLTDCRFEHLVVDMLAAMRRDWMGAEVETDGCVIRRSVGAFAERTNLVVSPESSVCDPDHVRYDWLMAPEEARRCWTERGTVVDFRD